MANKFDILITATDKATAVVAKVNRSIASITKPIADLRASSVAFAKEAGLDKVGKALVNVGRGALAAGEKIAGVAAAITGVAGVSSIAGVAALATEWAHLGAEIGRSAATIGVSSGALQDLRGAARLT